MLIRKSWRSTKMINFESQLQFDLKIPDFVTLSSVRSTADRSFGTGCSIFRIRIWWQDVSTTITSLSATVRLLLPAAAQNPFHSSLCSNIINCSNIQPPTHLLSILCTEQCTLEGYFTVVYCVAVLWPWKVYCGCISCTVFVDLGECSVWLCIGVGRPGRGS